MPEWLTQIMKVYGPLGIGWVVAGILARILYNLLISNIEHAKSETAAKLELASAIREMKETINALIPS